MKRKMSIFIIAILVLVMAVPAFAASVSTGQGSTSGGTLGKCRVTGTLNYANSTSAGGDWAQAITQSTAIGKLGARAVVWYTGPTGNKTASKESIKSSTAKVTTAKAYAPSGTHGYKVTGGHTYSSSDYGSWTKGTSKTF